MASDKSRGRGYIDVCLALAMTVLLALAAHAAGGFYYDLNDDVLIKDILSGVYTGQPEGHTMQILYPLGWILSLLYHIPRIPVFGVFLCLCQFGSIFVIAYRSLVFFQKKAAKILAVSAQFCFWAGCCMEQLVFVQYTVTAGMLITAAIFWLATSRQYSRVLDKSGGIGGCVRTVVWYIRENLPALLLYWTGFCLRSEMGLLLLPLAGAVGICKWFSHIHPFRKEKAAGYLGLFAVLMAGIGASLIMDKAAYGSRQWQEFVRFFDARTTVYDYQRDVVESFEQNQDIYEAMEVSEARQMLLKNYNFGVDDQIDAVFLEELAQRAKNREQGGIFRKDFRTGIWELVYGHFLARTENGLNVVMIGLGLILFLYGFRKGKYTLLWQVPLLTGGCSVLWLFLILRDRLPVRISVPLYLALIAAFGGLLMAAGSVRADEHEQTKDLMHTESLAQTEDPMQSENTGRKSTRYRKVFLLAAAVILTVSGLAAAPEKISEVQEQIRVREAANAVNEAMLSWCEQNPECLFLADVYTTVSFSEKMGVDRKKPFNYDLLGGWLAKSPLTVQKLEAFGLHSMGEAVAGKEQVRIFAEAESDLGWLESFLAERGIKIQTVCEAQIADGAVCVYRIEAE